ncbi:hypothetical protein [Galenea microaerophila]
MDKINVKNLLKSSGMKGVIGFALGMAVTMYFETSYFQNQEQKIVGEVQKIQTKVEHVTQSDVDQALKQAQKDFPNTQWNYAKVSDVHHGIIELHPKGDKTPFLYDPIRKIYFIGLVINPKNKTAKIAGGKVNE